MTTNKKIRIITTVGTSIISNFLDKPDNKKLSDNIKELQEEKKTSTQKIYFSDTKWNDHVNKWKVQNSLKSKIFSFAKTAKEKSCAELQSIAQIAKGYDEVEIILLSSYTLDGYLAATIVKGLLEDETVLGFKSTVVLANPIEGLVVDKADEFQSKVINFLANLIEKESKKNDAEIVLNVTGGYKALIPFMTIIGQLKKLELKYIYEESDKLITVGNLPISLDWKIIEALKPCWKGYFLKENLNDIAQQVFENNIEFSKKDGKYLGDDTINNKTTELHQLLRLLIKYELVVWDKDNKLLKESALATIIKDGDSASSADSGYIMEYLLGRYFRRKTKHPLVCDYKLNSEEIKLKSSFFEVIKGVDKKLTVSLKNIGSEIGDIDILLSKQTTIVWGEAKAFNVACGYANKIGKQKDYFHQLQARYLALEEAMSAIDGFEILFIVFKFTIKNINHDESLKASDYLKKVLCHFQEIKNFKAIGIKVPIDFDSETGAFNFTTLYNGDNMNKWEFEDLYIDSKICKSFNKETDNV